MRSKKISDFDRNYHFTIFQKIRIFSGFIAEEGRCKAEVETARLEVEWTSLLLELRATKDEVSSLYS